MLNGTALLPLLALLLAEEPRPQGVVTRVIIEEEVIMRVPVQPRSPPGQWRESGGAKCLATGELVGAVLAGPDSIDFLLRNQARYRATLDSGCPTLDFYGGFYLQPEGERLCAGRDAIRSRMGATCRIEQFRRLQPTTADEPAARGQQFRRVERPRRQ